MRPIAPALLVCLATLVPGAALACNLPPNLDGLRAEVTALVNEQRKAKGLPAVSAHPVLTKAAQTHACDNADSGRMSHEGSNGSTLTDRLANVGYAYRAAAENVAAGYTDAKSVMTGWINSNGHRRNILSPEAEDIGIGIAIDEAGTPYWTMNLGRE